MKTLICIVIITFTVHLSNQEKCHQTASQKQLKYLRKLKYLKAEIGYGQQIVVIQPPAPNLADALAAIDDRHIMSRLNFTKQDRANVLGELLTFQCDTIKSNKLLYIRGKWKNVEDKDFTIEIEALYTFTRMLTEGNPRILPVLIERKSQKVVTGDRKTIDKIYRIYRKWLLANQKTDFNNLTYPLVGSPYDWSGNENPMVYLKKSL